MKAFKKHRAKINYAVDLIIGAGFLLSALSGLVLFFAGSSGGYQGGRNPAWGRAVMGLSRNGWMSLHDCSSIVMIVGVLGHFILHWNWLVCMTRNVVRRARKRSPSNEYQGAEDCPV